jgi:hypothetical protein
MQLDGLIQNAANSLSGERQGELLSSLDMLSRHGPPLTAFSQDPGSPYAPVALDDDRGAFIYFPLAAHLLGTSDLGALLKWSFIVFFVPLLLVYPLLLYELTGSIVASFAAPPLLLSHSAFFRNSGIFWLPAWANLLLLPLLLLIAKRWKQSRLWLLVGLTVVASFASSIRANAGLGFLIGAVILVCVRMPRWRLRLVSAGLLILAYLSIMSFAMHAVQVQRDDVVGRDFTSAYGTSHPLWHQAYLGLGYLKNPYGIRPTDATSFAAAEKQDPGSVYYTLRYERALRTAYFHIFERHPGFVLHGFAVKAGVTLSRAGDWFPAAMVLVPLTLLFGERRRERLFQGSLLLGAGIVGAATGIIVTPTAIPEIFSGWYSFLLLLWLFSLGWLARPLEARTWQLAVRLSNRWIGGAPYRTLPLTSRWALRARLVLVSAKIRRHVIAGISAATPRHVGRVALAAAAVIAVFAIQLPARSADAASFYWGHETPLVPRASIHGTLAARWELREGVPSDWRMLAQRVRRTADGLLIRTTKPKWSYQLAPPVRMLEPGRYDLVVDGKVLDGGLELGAVDQRTASFIAVNYYSASADYSNDKRIALSFELAKTTEVQFVLANLTILSRSSDWILRSLALVREPGGCRLETPYAWFTP